MRHLILKKISIALVILTMFNISIAFSQELSKKSIHMFELGFGWANAGNTLQEELQWKPALQGSRKGVSANIGWRRLGTNKIYYSPFVKLDYTNAWSIGGEVNMMGLETGLAGLGVYMTKPMSFYESKQKYNRLYATFDINFAALRFGGNLNPDFATQSVIKDSKAYKARLKERREEDLKDLGNFGKVYKESVIETQRYPFGEEYIFIRYAIPVQFQVWYAMEHVALGGFFQLEALALEIPLVETYRGSVTYDYSVLFGFSVSVL